MNKNYDKMKDLLENNIAKYFENDGGGLHFHSFDGNLLQVRMTGKCHNCPSAIAEVETIVLEDIRKEFPQVEKIQIVNEISEELLTFAKQILSHN